MPLSVARITTNHEKFFCPFTGKPVEIDGDIQELETLLFVYYGDAGDYAYCSERFLRMATEANLEIENGQVVSDPDEVAEQLDANNIFLLEVDAGWNGVNTYGFVASEKE